MSAKSANAGSTSGTSKKQDVESKMSGLSSESASTSSSSSTFAANSSSTLPAFANLPPPGVSALSDARHIYVSTVCRPSAVTHSIVANFTGRNETNLILVKFYYLEIYRCTASDVVLVHSQALPCRVQAITKFNPSTFASASGNSSTASATALSISNSANTSHANVSDRLMLLTERHRLVVLSWESGCLLSTFSLDLEKRPGQDSDFRSALLIDESRRIAVIHQYTGLLQVLLADQRANWSDHIYEYRLDYLKLIKIIQIDANKHTQNSAPTTATIASSSASSASASSTSSSSSSSSSSSTSSFSRGCYVMLVEDHLHRRHLLSFFLDLREKELLPGPIRINNLQSSTNNVFSFQNVGGLLILSDQQIEYVNQQVRKTLPMQSTAHILAAECIPNHDGSGSANGSIIGDSGQEGRIIFSDLAARLFVASVKLKQSSDHMDIASGPSNTSSASRSNDDFELSVEELGVCSCAQSLTYIAFGVVFVGSVFGDSSLIQLHTEFQEDSKSFISVLRTFSNIGSIADMAVMSSERVGSAKLITCSGAYTSGSLRILRKGVAVHEEARMQLPAMNGIWSVEEPHAVATSAANSSNGISQSFHRALIQSFVHETRVLALQNESLEELTDHELDSAHASIYCANVGAHHLIQVTAHAVTLLDRQHLRKVSEWRPAAQTDSNALATSSASPAHSAPITRAHSCDDLILLACGPALYLLTVSQGQDISHPALSLRGHSTLLNEVSCLAVWHSGSSSFGYLACVGFWSDLSLRFVCLDSGRLFAAVHEEPLSGDMIPRSLAFADFGGKSFLFAGLGDGALLSYALQCNESTVQLKSAERHTIGRQPIELVHLQLSSGPAVFAACDSPTVILLEQPDDEQLSYWPVDCEANSGVCKFSTRLFGECLAFMHNQSQSQQQQHHRIDERERNVESDDDSGSLLIARLDWSQKLQIRSLPLHQQPRRVAFDSHSRTLLVGTIRFAVDTANQHTSGEIGELHLYDANILALQHSITLMPNEQVTSAITFDTARTAQINSNAELDGLSMNMTDNNSSNSSLSSATESSSCYFVVGTAFIQASETHPRRGRILLYEVSADRQLQLCSKVTVKGGVYALAQYDSQFFVAGVNANVALFAVIPNSSSTATAASTTGSSNVRIQHCATHGGNVVSLNIRVFNQRIIVSDFLKSVSILVLQESKKAAPSTSSSTATAASRASATASNSLAAVSAGYELKEACRDYEIRYLTAVDGVSDQLVLAADHQYNLIMLGPWMSGASIGGTASAAADSEEDQHRLDCVARFYLGDQINVIRRGALVSNVTDLDREDLAEATHIMGGLSGAVYAVCTLSKSMFSLLSKLQDAMRSSVAAVFGVSNKEWRTFFHSKPHRAGSAVTAFPSSSSSGERIIDGDFVEDFLHLAKSKQDTIAKSLETDSRTLCKLLTRLHRMH